MRFLWFQKWIRKSNLANYDTRFHKIMWFSFDIFFLGLNFRTLFSFYHVLISLPKSESFTFNPYRQIPETISKKRAVTQGISRKLFPGFFKILQFWGVTQGIFRKLFPGKFHEYLPMKKYFFPKTGHDSEAFPETFSNIWK